MRIFLTILAVMVVVPFSLSLIMGVPNNSAMAFDASRMIPCLVFAAVFRWVCSTSKYATPVRLLFASLLAARVAGYGALFGLTFFAFGLASATLGAWSWQEGWDLVVPYWLIASLVAPIVAIGIAAAFVAQPRFAIPNGRRCSSISR